MMRAIGVVIAVVALQACAYVGTGQETDCITRAQQSNDPPGSADLTLVSGNDGNETFIRLSWEASGVGVERLRAYECRYWGNWLIASFPSSSDWAPIK